MINDTESSIQLFDDEGAIYMGAQRELQNCEIGIFGVPYDGTTSYRAGTRFGPAKIREVSSCLETFCPQQELDLEDIKYADLGALKISNGSPEPVIEKVISGTKYLLEHNLKPIMLGGEHSITYGAIKTILKKYPDTILIQLDAHADLRDEWLGEKHNHACAMRRCLDIIPSKNLFQVGIRSGTKNEFKELKKSGRLIKSNNKSIAENLKERLSSYQKNPIYITIDLDWFDTSVIPGTGTPEPGGFFWKDFSEIINVVKNFNLVGGDIVELAPQYDISDCSSILAAKIVRSLILLASK
tara:strand:+ start:5047 stop:5940 length:894 start_codon:yes stop_codon:yes gene_type:complete